MITIILLTIIYLAFISLGLPDSILGAAMPAIVDDMGFRLSAGGTISMVTILGGVISSFLSEKIIRKTGTGKIVFLSCLLTGTVLVGYSFAPSYIWLMLLALPLGLGGGTVDAALNNYVAMNFKAHHMNWLHSFWGVGATLGPIIMSWNLVNSSWRIGYRTIGTIQLTLAAILMISLPIWGKHRTVNSTSDNSRDSKSDKVNVFKVKGLKYALLIMGLYCSAEVGTGLWGSSYLVGYRGFTTDTAARFIALYYGGITIGRVVAGFISFKLNNKQMIHYGILISLIGAVLLLLPLPGLIAGGALVLMGVGFAPIFPAMIHEVPARFGNELSQKIVGYHMGFAYLGSAFMPAILGVLFDFISVRLLPLTLFILIASILVSTILLNKSVRNK